MIRLRFLGLNTKILFSYFSVCTFYVTFWWDVKLISGRGCRSKSGDRKDAPLQHSCRQIWLNTFFGKPRNAARAFPSTSTIPKPPKTPKLEDFLRGSTVDCDWFLPFFPSIRPFVTNKTQKHKLGLHNMLVFHRHSNTAQQ